MKSSEGENGSKEYYLKSSNPHFSPLAGNNLKSSFEISQSIISSDIFLSMIWFNENDLFSRDAAMMGMGYFRRGENVDDQLQRYFHTDVVYLQYFLSAE